MAIPNKKNATISWLHLASHDARRQRVYTRPSIARSIAAGAAAAHAAKTVVKKVFVRICEGTCAGHARQLGRCNWTLASAPSSGAYLRQVLDDEDTRSSWVLLRSRSSRPKSKDNPEVLELKFFRPQAVFRVFNAGSHSTSDFLL